MSGNVSRSQNMFLMQGGVYQFALANLYENGTFPAEYVYHEYPRMVRLSRGVREFKHHTETCEKGHYIDWTEQREVFEDIIVNSEEEEERVLSGGKTSSQLEDERQGLIQRCRTMGIPADPGWSAVRLRRELGDALDAPAPGDDMAKLESELANLRKMAAMQAEIEALRAQLAGPRRVSSVAEPYELADSLIPQTAQDVPFQTEPEEIEELRAQLTALGVPFHHRHGVERLRDLLEAATAPEGVR